MNSKTNIFKNLLWIIKHIYSYDKKYIFVMFFAVIIMGIIPTISTLISQIIINGIQNRSGLNITISYVIIYMIIDLFQSLFIYLWQYCKVRFSLGFHLYFNELILKKAANLNLKNYEDSETYDMINRAQYEGNGKLLAYLDSFIGISSSLISMISYLIIIMTFKFWIVICIVFVPFLKFLINIQINIKSFNIIKSRTNDSRKCWYIQYLLTYGESFKELKIYNLFDYFINRYKSYCKKFNKDDLILEKERDTILGGVTIIENIIDGVLFSYIAFYGYTGRILIGNVLTYMKTIAQIKSQIASVLETLSNINKESLFVDQLKNYFDLSESNKSDLVKIGKIENIKIRNLYYKYQNEQDYVLKDINLNIKKGKTIAIIGQNGSGKSTLAKIILGFYEDYEGEVFINDINLKSIDKSSLLDKVATLFQDFVKYEATFRENISYGNLDILNNDRRIYYIANEFGLQKLISESKNKLDCQIGNWFDNGKQISLGQWQKIALSRAFAKDADVYILDEPNSALDPIAEYNLSQQYSKLLENKMGIIIAHKFNNFIQNIDEVIVLSNGEIVGRGTHDSLIRKNKKYKDLYEIQLGNYKEQNGF